jgi:predicted cupin superfamily sugar epimerase
MSSHKSRKQRQQQQQQQQTCMYFTLSQKQLEPKWPRITAANMNVYYLVPKKLEPRWPRTTAANISEHTYGKRGNTI